MSLNSTIPSSNEGVAPANTNGTDSNTDLRNPHSALGVEEIVNEEEARKRREQLNRRPSYRMILKDLETVGDKPLKKELGDNSPSTFNHEQTGSSSSDNTNFSNSNNAVIGGLPAGPGLKPPNLTAGLRVGVVGTAAATNQITHISPSAQQHLSIGQLNLIANPPQQGRLITADMPSQPQPQLPPNTTPQPLLTAVNNLEMLGLKAPETLTAAFIPNDWQNNLLSSYNRNQQIQQQQQQQSQSQAHLLPNNSSVPSPLSINNMQVGPGVSNIQPQIGPPHGLGNRQGSASLTSFSPIQRSDNDDNNRKRQVRLLKNREAAKECRRKKKEYVKCLENRVAVLENQNKALIEELKTLKELYCRKEKGDLQ